MATGTDRGKPLTTATTVRPALSASWPVWVLFAAYPVWWFLGTTALIWAGVGCLVLFKILQQRQVRVPKGFAWWLLFLAWVIISGTQVSSLDRAMAFLFRGSAYFSATVLFLYLYNAPPWLIPSSRVIRAMAVFWCGVAVGGLVGVLFPRVSFTSVVEAMLPNSLLDVNFIRSLVHPRLAQVSRVLGFEVGRPLAPFPFTNAWGSNFALLTPFVIMSWQDGSRGWNRMTRGLLVAAIFPVILSLNRGLWVSLGVGVVYAAVRFSFQRRLRGLLTVCGFLFVVVAALSLTSLGSVVRDRSERGHSNEGREELYRESLDKTAASPILGYGVPQPSASEDKPSVGTHGQFWLVLVSQGVPGAVLFLGWYVTLLLKTGRRTDERDVWCHVVVLISLVQLPFYEQLPAQLHITMVAAALVLRSRGIVEAEEVRREQSVVHR